MKRWLGPSLLRRTVLALLAALVLVWIVLSLKDFWSFKQDVRDRESFGKIARATLNSLQGMDEQKARVALLAADRQYNEMRRNAENAAPGALLFQLRSAQGALVYRSEGGTPTDAAASSRSGEVEFQGTRYWVMAQEDLRWRLVVWVPVMSDASALALIGQDILGYLLLALPFVALPMALAVWLGLRPLRGLVRQIAERPAGDFSALKEPTGYAELAPLVEAGNALLARARRQREVEQAFVQDAAHELKTPLAAIAAQAHVLVRSVDATQRTDSLVALERGVARVSRQVDQLLALSVLDGDNPCEWAMVDLVAMAQDALAELAPLADAQGVELALEGPDRLTVSAEATSVRSILGNLLGNALLHAGGNRVEVRLSVAGSQVALIVADNGHGIPVSERPRVSKRFHRGSSAGGSGSGLGLSIVQRAAARMGGSMGIQNGLDGRGVAVAVHWPVVPASTPGSLAP